MSREPATIQLTLLAPTRGAFLIPEHDEFTTFDELLAEDEFNQLLEQSAMCHPDPLI